MRAYTDLPVPASYVRDFTVEKVWVMGAQKFNRKMQWHLYYKGEFLSEAATQKIVRSKIKDHYIDSLINKGAIKYLNTYKKDSYVKVK